MASVDPGKGSYPSRSPENRQTLMQPEPGQDLHKVVVHLQNGTVQRGYYQEPLPLTLDALLEKPYHHIPSPLVLTDPEDGKAFEVDTSNVKALYFVKSFEGAKEKLSIRFYTHGPAVHGIWVEIRFKDGEVLEGIIQNSLRHLVEDGFLLTPSDPESNSHVVYVPKNSITDYRVLGVRTIG